MGRCKNCKFWNVYHEKECDRPDTIWDVAIPEDERFDIVATANDDQGLEARLITGPEFGCIHFTEKGVDYRE